MRTHDHREGRGVTHHRTHGPDDRSPSPASTRPTRPARGAARGRRARRAQGRVHDGRRARGLRGRVRRLLRRRALRRRLLRHRGHLARAARARTSAPATRSSSPPTRSSRPPRPSAGSARRRSSSTSTRHTHLLTAEAVAAAIGPRTRGRDPRAPDGLDGRPRPDPRRSRASAGLRVIEDTAQAHGADHRGRRVGSIGDIGCFSFYPTKNLGGWGDGGAIVTSDEELAARVRLLRSHGETPRYHHRIVGTTARLDALQAALLRVKLRHLDDRNADRRRLGAALRAGLAGTSVELPAPAFDGRRPRLPPVHRALRAARRAARAPRGARRLDAPSTTRSRSTAPRPTGSQPEGSLPVAERLARGDLHAAAVPDHVRRGGRARHRRGRSPSIPRSSQDGP